jgi:hypothetical protein
VRSHDDEIRLIASAVLRMPSKGSPSATISDAAKLCYGPYLLGQDSRGFPLLHRHELLRLVVIDDVNERKLCAERLGPAAPLAARPDLSGWKNQSRRVFAFLTSKPQTARAKLCALPALFGTSICPCRI